MTMRNKMPWCAAVVDGLREVFGADEINRVIRIGLSPACREEDRVYFCEAGHALGRQWVPDPGKTVSASQMVVVRPVKQAKGAPR
jgi:hypothetical protein